MGTEKNHLQIAKDNLARAIEIKKKSKFFTDVDALRISQAAATIALAEELRKKKEGK